MSRLRLILAVAAGVALVGLVAGGARDLAGAAHGWLLGFVFASLAPSGALMLLMIARLTRAPWGEAFGPQLRAVAATAPWLWLLGAPIAFLLAATYPWARPGGAPAHLQLYLSPGPFLGRSAVALAGWSLLALIVRRGRLGQGLAAFGLLFEAVALGIIPNDWVLSAQPGWTTTDIGMTFLALQVALIAALVLLLGPGGRGRSADDLAGFLIAGVLALAYLTFVAYLVDWYGDLPDRVGWWMARLADGRWIVIDAALLAGLLCFACLAFGRRYRVAGAFALAGLAVYCAWLLSPTLGALAWLFAPAGLVFNACALALAASGGFAGVHRAGAAHG